MFAALPILCPLLLPILLPIPLPILCLHIGIPTMQSLIIPSTNFSLNTSQHRPHLPEEALLLLLLMILLLLLLLLLLLSAA